MYLFSQDKTFIQRVNLTAAFMAAFHVGAVAALFFFTWKVLIVAVVLWWVAGSLGIGMGYHSLLTHRGYKAPKVVEYFLTVCGTLALEGGPIAWVATHRVHHQAQMQILVADDHEVVRKGVRAILTSHFRGMECIEATNRTRRDQ